MTHLIEKMKQNAKAHNRFLTEEYLSTLSFKGLLCYMHPVDREEYIQKLKKAKLI